MEVVRHGRGKRLENACGWNTPSRVRFS